MLSEDSDKLSSLRTSTENESMNLNLSSSPVKVLSEAEREKRYGYLARHESGKFS